MEKVKNRSEYFPYEIAILSLVPWIGVLFGITSIIWGAVKKNGKLIVIGFAGILVTVLCGVLYYYGIKRSTSSHLEYFDSIWQPLFFYIIAQWFWIMIVATLLTFALIILSKIFHKKLFHLKGAFLGFLIWTTISIPIDLEDHFHMIGLFSHEEWLGVLSFYMPSVVVFIVGGFSVGLFLERKLKIKQRSLLRNISIYLILLWGFYLILTLFDVMGQYWYFYFKLIFELTYLCIFLFFISVGVLIRSIIKKYGDTRSRLVTVFIYAIVSFLYLQPIHFLVSL